MTIKTNVSALQTINAINKNNAALASSMQKLSIASAINTTADDAAGSAVVIGLQSQIGGLTQAGKNTASGIALVQIASGALKSVSDILQRVRDLTVQAGTDTNDTNSRLDIRTEVNALADQLTQISASTNYNGVKLLDSTANLTLQVGSGSVAVNDQIGIDLTGVKIAAIVTAVKAIDLTTASGSLAGIGTLDANIQSISTTSASLGATQNRLNYVASTLATNIENLQEAKSTIADTDTASEMANFTKLNVLTQAGTAMLSQANQQNQQVLKLLQG
ncbi:hypothetical protein ATY41_09775 [Leifsonia xyli subsp. xyli]|nr:flagellin [Leifsonia xyli]ODA90524.1 hypothetical protein ATY41_09775 [Leifsonia xyli subsp. xyli]